MLQRQRAGTAMVPTGLPVPACCCLDTCSMTQTLLLLCCSLGEEGGPRFDRNRIVLLPTAAHLEEVI
jgi:hypothetical protein